MIESGDHRLYQLMRDRQRSRIAFQMVFANFDGKIGWQQDPKWTLFEQNRLARQLLKKLAQLDDRLAVGEDALTLSLMRCARCAAT